jgi:membrane-associated protease RseP (regulator of RpoE activity)
LTDLPLPTEDTKREQRRSVLLFFATLGCVYLVYGFQWTAGNPLTDADSAVASAKFAVALMAILLSHEMAHYVVAKAHGFALSLPYFLPFPAAFGTFGAIIRLRSLPQSRTGLLEMGAAGPLAGFVVAVAAIALGLPDTVEHVAPELIWDPAILEALRAPIETPGAVDGAIATVLGWLGTDVGPTEVPLMVLANPPIMDMLGTLVLGAPPSRYATLDPLATAGWVGCLLTAINMIPIGQLDGGHILNAIAPSVAPRVSKLLLAVAVVAGLLWTGWIFWAVMLWLLGAWVSLPVPATPPLSRRAIVMAVLATGAMLLSFMPRPLELEGFEVTELEWVTEDGAPITAELRAALKASVAERLDPGASQR